MISIQESLQERPWAKYIKGNLVHDDVLGFTTKSEIDEAIACKAIIKLDGKSCVPFEKVVATVDAPGKSGERRYSKCDLITVISPAYHSFIANRAKRASAKRYHDEAINAALLGIST